MSARSGDLTEKWYEYVYRDRADSVRRFVENYPDERSLSVSCDRFGHDYRFVRPLLSRPDEALRAGKNALGRFLSGATDREMEDIYLRVTDLPGESEVAISELRATHLNHLHTTRGVVSETDSIRPKVVRAGFRCAKCEEVTRHVSQTGREFRPHAKCPKCNSVGYLSFEPDRSDYVDAQEVTLRDPAGGEEVTVLLEHDLAGSAADGDEVEVVGIPRATPVEDSTVTDLWVESVSMECLTSTNQ